MPNEPKHTLAAPNITVSLHYCPTGGTPVINKRGGACAANTKNTPSMEDAILGYLEDNCQYTLSQMREMLHLDFGVPISTSLISKKLCDKLPYLALSHVKMLSAPYDQKTELRMQLLRKAAEHTMHIIDVRLVNKMARYCAFSVAVASRSEPMEYRT
ncbi:Hypothetical protein PHPALM_19866 [Phytophthora palmivora]|uniref:Transposase n=1 Tax=Phytophthora palmivora TaxID=4796 RepID=A0A2P4XGA7_9STRA|nr:Hypothetical protein PHPALM_19866 [Phytophthora palmivora]